MPAFVVTPADAQERDRLEELVAAVPAATGASVVLAWVAQGSTGAEPAAAAARHGVRLEGFKLPEAKRGFVLPPRRWVVERSCAWVASFRRFAQGDERLPETVADLHLLAFACPTLQRLLNVVAQRS